MSCCSSASPLVAAAVWMFIAVTPEQAEGLMLIEAIITGTISLIILSAAST